MTDLDRAAPRRRPDTRPAMHQSWGALLFMHWPIDAALLRPLIPPRLEIDAFGGTAWIGVVPFTMWGIRPAGLPAVPGVSRFHELNVRTYVHHQGVPGVWFFSLDASGRLAVRVARRFFHLPYFDAAMRLDRRRDGRIDYASRRTHRGAPPAFFEGVWTPGAARPEPEPASLDFFLTERYYLFSARGGRLYRGRIHHPPWPLRDAMLHHYRSSMLAAHGLPEPTTPPLLHHADELHVAIWPLEQAGPAR
ncbi:MAG: DUF2071 domain-containing protein [Rhodothermales bacterium]|nr:DUF2071 domain-containing protein [Rhodothermales bacterium]